MTFRNSAIWKRGVCDTWFERKVNEICKIPSTLELCSTRTIANLFPNSLQMLCSQIANRIHEQILEMSFNCHRMAFNWHRMAFDWHIDRPWLQFCKKSTHKGAVTVVLQFKASADEVFIYLMIIITKGFLSQILKSQWF